MDDFVSRTELSPVDRAVVRASSPVPAIQSVSARRTNDAMAQEKRSALPQPDVAGSSQEELASLAEYVEVHVRIAEILADLDAGSTDLARAQDAVQAMIPKPMVLVPLPPASKEAVEHAADVARRIVARAAHAHAGQAHLQRATVEQVAVSAG